MRETDRDREAFIRRYFPGSRFAPEQFSVTFNTEQLSDTLIVAAIATLLTTKSSEPAR